MEFIGYYGKHRQRASPVAQVNVAQKISVVRARVSPVLKERIMCRAKEINSTESEMTRILWNDYFRKFDELSQKADVIHFLKNA